MFDEKEFHRLVDATKESTEVLGAIYAGKDLIDVFIRNYGEYMSDESRTKLNEVMTELKGSIHKTNLAIEDVFQQLKNFKMGPVTEKPKYESFVIPRDFISFENDKRILIRIPDEMEYGGYSIWSSKKFVTDDPTGEMLQVRFYPDWKVKLYKYVQDETGKYQTADTMEVVAETLFPVLSDLNDSYHRDDLSAAL